MLHLALGSNDAAPMSVLCLGAHSDDLEIGCGGTLMALVASQPQVRVDWVVFSASDARAAEARAGAACVLRGAARISVTVEAFRDGFFPYVGDEVKEYFEGLKDRCSPDLIFTHHRDDRHQDHRLIAELTWNTFRDHLILEYEIPKYDGELGAPNLFVPLDESTCRRKVRAITDTFQTQRSRRWFSDDTFLSLLRLRGLEAGSPTGYAEAFFCRKGVVALVPDSASRRPALADVVSAGAPGRPGSRAAGD